MSPLWADQLTVFLSPTELLAGHRSRGVRPAPMALTKTPVSDQIAGRSSWEPAVAELDHLLQQNPHWAGASLRLVLSNHFVRYALVPWSDDVTNEREYLALARRQFVLTHGRAATHWDIRMRLSDPGESHVACALDTPLLEEIRRIAQGHRLRLTGAEPLLMAGFNRWRPSLRTSSHWFLLVEPGMIFGAYVHNHRWQALRHWRILGDWTTELPLWLSREQLLTEQSDRRAALYLLAPDHPGLHPDDFDVPVHWLKSRNHGEVGWTTHKIEAHPELETECFACIL